MQVPPEQELNPWAMQSLLHAPQLEGSEEVSVHPAPQFM